MTSAVVWLLAGGLSAAIVGGYALAFRRRNHRDHERLSAAVEAGIAKPAGRYPWIDPARCIGCATCVKACPEGDVLGVVGGLAVVVDGLRCVGLAFCQEACPVGAITVGLGEAHRRADVPPTDEQHRSLVAPGVYVVGELGGLALIRNAVAQGRQAVLDLARRRDLTGPSDAVDLVIAGAGPAGLSAALTAREQGLSFVLLEQESDLGGTVLKYPRRKLVMTEPVEIPLYGALRRREVAKEELLELFAGLVERHDLSCRFGEPLLDVHRNGGLEVRTPAGVHRARGLILALGRRGSPRRLEVPGEELPKVLYQVRDAELLRQRRILVVGGGDSAVEAAIGLSRQPGNQVAISYRRERFVRLKAKNAERLEARIARGRIQPLMASKVLEITPDAVRLEVAGENLRLPNDDVFVLIGGTPHLPLLRRIGVLAPEADQ